MSAVGPGNLFPVAGLGGTVSKACSASVVHDLTSDSLSDTIARALNVLVELVPSISLATVPPLSRLASWID